MKREKHKKSRKHAGFTLIELLAVIAIIALISNIILVSVNGARARARDAKRKGDFKQLQTALELYFSQLDTYPADVAWCDSSKGVLAPSCVGYVGNAWPSGGLQQLEAQGIVAKLPIDPLNSELYFYYYEPVVNQNQFGVTCGATVCAYKISTFLETETGSPGCHGNYPIHNYCLEGGGAFGPS